MTGERERAIEAVRSVRLNFGADDLFEVTDAKLSEDAAGRIVDALLALPDPVREAAREVVASFDHGFVPWDAFDRLRAALEENEKPAE